MAKYDASKITPGPQNPGKYPRVGPNYRQYGEVPGWVYIPALDEYKFNEKEYRETLENAGAIDKEKKQPSANAQLGIAAGTAVAGYLGKQAFEHYAPSIWGGIKSAFSGEAAKTIGGEAIKQVGGEVVKQGAQEIGNQAVQSIGGEAVKQGVSQVGEQVGGQVAQTAAENAAYNAAATEAGGGLAGGQAAASTYGQTFASYAGPAVVAYGVTKLIEGLGKVSRIGESNLIEKDWYKLAQRGFAVPADFQTRKAAQNNEVFKASRNEGDLTAEDVNETAAPRLLFPDWDTGFTPQQQTAILEKALQLGLVRERNGGIRIEGPGTQGKSGESGFKGKEQELKQLWDTANDIRRQNATSGDTTLQPINPEETIPPQVVFIKDRATGDLIPMASGGNGKYSGVYRGQLINGSGSDLVSYNVWDVENGKPKAGTVPSGLGEDAATLNEYTNSFRAGGSVESPKQADSLKRAIDSRRELQRISSGAGAQSIAPPPSAQAPAVPPPAQAAVNDIGSSAPQGPGAPPLIPNGTPPAASGPQNTGPSQLPPGTAKGAGLLAAGGPGLNNSYAPASAEQKRVANKFGLIGPVLGDPGFSQGYDPTKRPPVDPNNPAYQLAPTPINPLATAKPGMGGLLGAQPMMPMEQTITAEQAKSVGFRGKRVDGIPVSQLEGWQKQRLGLLA